MRQPNPARVIGRVIRLEYFFRKRFYILHGRRGTSWYT